MIRRVRALCQADSRLLGAVMYGSFARGEGDRYSDIEFVFFFADNALPELDQRSWIEQIAPVELYFADDIGHNTAIFASLIRGEFHFEPMSQIAKVDTWRGSDWLTSVDNCLLIDRTGELRRRLAPLIGRPPARDTPDQAQAVAANLASWWLFGATVFERGEHARALEILGLVHRQLLWLARLAESATEHWPTPAHAAERDLSPAAYARFVACTSALVPDSLAAAYRESWRWGSELLASLTTRHGPLIPESLAAKLTKLGSTIGTDNQSPGGELQRPASVDEHWVRR